MNFYSYKNFCPGLLKLYLKKSNRLLLLTCLLLLSTITIYSQDTLELPGKPEQFRLDAEEFLKANRKKITDKQHIELQNKKANQLKNAVSVTQDYFKKGLDTNKINRQLVQLEELYLLTTNGILTSSRKFFSLRNLTSSELLLGELLKKLESLNKPLTIYKKEVEKKRAILDSLAADSALYFLPADTTLFNAYEAGYILLIKQLIPVDSMLNNAANNLMQLDNRSAKLKGEILLDIYKIDTYRKDLSMTMFKQEMPSIFSRAEKERPFLDTLSFSFFKAYHIILFFFENNPGIILLILLLMAGIYYFFLITGKRVTTANGNAELKSNNEITEYPFLTSLFVVLNIGQFFFAFPPFVLQAVLWLLMSVSLIIMHRKTPGMFGSKLWLFLLLFFILVVADNLILETSEFEKWFLLVISFFSVALALRFMRDRRQILREIQVAKWILFIFIALESIAFVAIIFGRYNLCKTLFTTGYFAVITGIFLYWTYHFLVKAINTYSATIPSYNIRNVIVKLKLLHDKMPKVFKGVFYFAWGILFLRNFYFYTVIRTYLTDLLYAERAIGKYSFTLESILIFVFILFLSGFLSKLISFLTDSSSQMVSGPFQKKGGISNWLLLIRLAIIIIGVILAFAAAGIPMNRLTIIIGSLGLGIGFGLQNIVSNLISGVILAFERPIEIGDQIEVAGRTGRIKEIGIRSSKMVSLDGAEVIIPNGDLISQHVINWTLSNHHRRVEIIVGVKYGTDLQKAKQLLEGILQSNNRIKQIPAPVVLVNQFNNSSIDFRLLFWSDINVWLDLKSEIILSIDKTFKEEGIEIPFPQQDIYIKELPDSNNEEEKK